MIGGNMEKAFQNRVKYVVEWHAGAGDGYADPHLRTNFLIKIGMLEGAYFFTKDGLNSTIWAKTQLMRAVD